MRRSFKYWKRKADALGLAFRSKFFPAALLAVVSVLVSGCPECPSTAPPDEIKNADIAFSGKAVNSENPDVFGVADNGTNLFVILDGAEIYSKISKSGDAIVKKTEPDGKETLYKYNFETKKSSVIVSPGSFKKIDYPIIDASGKRIAFFADGNKIITGDGSGVWKVGEYEICPKAPPAFSPDGEKVAFFVGDSAQAPLIINVVDYQNPANQISYKALHFGARGIRSELELDWSAKNVIVYSYVKDDGKSYVGFWDRNDESSSYEIEISELGAFNPKISPDGKKIAFVDFNGDLWIRNAKEPPDWEQLTNVSSLEYISYPRWSSDGGKLLFVRRLKLDGEKYAGNLEAIDLASKKIVYLASGVYKAFWLE